MLSLRKSPFRKCDFQSLKDEKDLHIQWTEMGMWVWNVEHKGQHIKRPREKVPQKKVDITYLEQERQLYILHLLKSQNIFFSHSPVRSPA